MKKLAITMAVLIGFSLGSLAVAEPYAEVANPPSKESDFYGLWEMRLSKIQVPDDSRVGVPPYSGAIIIGVINPGEPDEAGPRNTAKITLLTTDGRQKVAAFYQQALQGWKQGGGQKNTYFWTESDVFALGPVAYRDIPSVVISDMGPMNFMEKALMPDAKSMITIIYKPE